MVHCHVASPCCVGWCDDERDPPGKPTWRGSLCSPPSMPDAPDGTAGSVTDATDTADLCGDTRRGGKATNECVRCVRHRWRPRPRCTAPPYFRHLNLSPS